MFGFESILPDDSAAGSRENEPDFTSKKIASGGDINALYEAAAGGSESAPDLADLIEGAERSDFPSPDPNSPDFLRALMGEADSESKESPGGSALAYPNEAEHLNNNWIIFKLNEYTFSKIKPGKDETVSTEGYSGLGNSRTGGLSALGIELIPAKKKTNTVIQLYMPHAITTNYGTQWGEFSAGGLVGTALESALKGEGAGKILTDGTKNLGLKALREGAASIINAAVPGNNYGSQAIAAMTKTIENPRREALFEGVNFRQFQFSFLFTPRNARESETAMNIISKFKINMHPELKPTDGGMYMTYPNDFDIEYRYKQDDNKFMNKFMTCVLTNMQVDYAPFGQFSTFDDGAPVAIRLSLQFQELEPLHRGHMKKGF